MLKLVYIAGKFSAPTRSGVEDNIMAAVMVGLAVAKLGGMPVIPHANTAHPEFEKVQEYPFWIEGTTELLRRCDAVMLVDGWAESNGARTEAIEAVSRRIPVFQPGEYEKLGMWLVLRAGAEAVR